MVNYCKSSKCLEGKTAIITGANTGIGYETALEFAKRDCRVILACRNREKANQARDKIISATENQNVVVKIIELDSMESVREFAKDIISTEDRLDLLVNNAGAYSAPKKITDDGLQALMAANYFSHFLLTNLLLDLLKKSAPSRIINVSSSMAKYARTLKFKDLNKHAGVNMLYAKTKLCNIFFTVELAKRLEGTNVTTYSLHPGPVNTEFQRSSKPLAFLAKRFFLTSREGAQTTLYVSLADGVEEHNGKHFEDCKPIKPYCTARSTEKATKLWEISEEMVGLKNSV